LRRKIKGDPEKKARTFNAADMEANRRGLQEELSAYRTNALAKVDAVKGDTARFFSEVCHLKPFAYQLELARLYRDNQFFAVRWPRQTGKSTFIGGLLLQDAYENVDLNIGFVGPSWRQSCRFLSRFACRRHFFGCNGYFGFLRFFFFGDLFLFSHKNSPI
jgi:hypothetical protein